MANSKKRSSRIVHYLSRSQTNKIKALCVLPAEKWTNSDEEKKQRNNLDISIRQIAFKWKIKSDHENFIPFILAVRRKAFSIGRYKKRICPALPNKEDLFSIFIC
jgi:hypothetical protein